MYKQVGKRLFDILITILALCFFAPIMGVIALFVRVNLGRPIYFSQKRPGLNGKPFTLHKFRTMTAAYDAHGNMRTDAERLTSFGRFLRTASLDELPELINVLQGEMSLVGPRPLLMQYLELYTALQVRRHEARPGITGLTQVKGRNALSWEQKFAFDVWYVDHLSFLLDLEILGLTVWKIIKCENISQPGQATMEEFRGTGGEREG